MRCFLTYGDRSTGGSIIIGFGYYGVESNFKLRLGDKKESVSHWPPDESKHSTKWLSYPPLSSSSSTATNTLLTSPNALDGQPWPNTVIAFTAIRDRRLLNSRITYERAAHLLRGIGLLEHPLRRNTGAFARRFLNLIRQECERGAGYRTSSKQPSDTFAFGLSSSLPSFHHPGVDMDYDEQRTGSQDGHEFHHEEDESINYAEMEPEYDMEFSQFAQNPIELPLSPPRTPSPETVLRRRAPSPFSDATSMTSVSSVETVGACNQRQRTCQFLMLNLRLLSRRSWAHVSCYCKTWTISASFAF